MKKIVENNSCPYCEGNSFSIRAIVEYNITVMDDGEIVLDELNQGYIPKIANYYYCNNCGKEFKVKKNHIVFN